MDKKFNVGIIGCGNISSVYLDVCKRFNFINIIACSDMIKERAISKAEEHNIPNACSIDEILRSDNIELVLNLTTPQAHTEVSTAILEGGKHLYSEKPLSLKPDQAKKLFCISEKKKMKIGCAPDTFLGAGFQTCRKIIDDGAIGEPAV